MIGYFTLANRWVTLQKKRKKKKKTVEKHVCITEKGGPFGTGGLSGIKAYQLTFFSKTLSCKCPNATIIRSQNVKRMIAKGSFTLIIHH